MDFIDLKTQYRRIETRIHSLTQAVYGHGQFILGPEVGELEKKFAQFVGAKHAITCANGTDALILSLLASGVGPGDEVILPSFSFFATVEAPILVGAKPVFVDIDPTTYLVTPGLIQAALTSKTKAVIPVSLYGQCPDLAAIEELCAPRGIRVIEDAAQSFGALRNGRRSCSFNALATTSFFPSKPLGAYGDGGAVFTSDDGLNEALRQLRFHGQTGRYHHVKVGLNSRLDTLQAAVLLAKLDIFEDELKLRDKVAQRYGLGLKGVVEAPHVLPGNTSAWAQYTIRVKNRDKFAEKLKAKGVPTAVHYPSPLHQQPAIRDRGLMPKHPLPACEDAAREVISLPMHPYLSEADQAQVVDAVRGALRAS